MYLKLNSKGFTLIELAACVTLFIFIVIGITLVKKPNKETYIGTVIDCREMITEDACNYAVELEVSEIGDILTFSSTDRQFALVKPQDYVTVVVQKYSKFNIEKAGTYYNGRLIKKHRRK